MHLAVAYTDESTDTGGVSDSSDGLPGPSTGFMHQGSNRKFLSAWQLPRPSHKEATAAKQAERQTPSISGACFRAPAHPEEAPLCEKQTPFLASACVEPASHPQTAFLSRARFRVPPQAEEAQLGKQMIDARFRAPAYPEHTQLYEQQAPFIEPKFSVPMYPEEAQLCENHAAIDPPLYVGRSANIQTAPFTNSVETLQWPPGLELLAPRTPAWQPEDPPQHHPWLFHESEGRRAAEEERIPEEPPFPVHQAPLTKSHKTALQQELSTNGDITTLMLCNIPCRYNVDEILDAINNEGFQNTYDFVYVPNRKELSQNMGYAFVNFKLPESASAFMKAFQDYKFLASETTKLSYAKPAQTQGYRRNLKLHRVKAGKGGRLRVFP